MSMEGGFPGASQLTGKRLAVLLCADQRERWRQGERTSAEEYRLRYPLLRSDPECLLDLVYNEIVLRQESGARPHLDEFTARFPDLAEPLGQLFEIEQALESAVRTDSDMSSTPPGKPGAAATGVAPRSD